MSGIKGKGHLRKERHCFEDGPVTLPNRDIVCHVDALEVLSEQI